MQEFPTFKKAWSRSSILVEIVYPNKYYGGVYCLAPLILYNLINSTNNFICERRFLDHSNRLHSNFIGFTFQYELDYYNFFKILKHNSILLDKKNRKQIIFAGGPCINLNPNPLSDYIDFFIIGEAEPVMPNILKVYSSSTDKKDFLSGISKFAGVYVPAISDKQTTVLADMSNMQAYPFFQPLPIKLSREFVFGNAFILEIERGCPYHCKFCPMPELHPRARYRKYIKEIIDEGLKINKRKKVVIYSASFTHPDKKDILQHMINKGVQFSIPSIKIESIDSELLALIKEGGQKTLTIAPECGSTLRKDIGKDFSDEKLFDFVEKAKQNNFKSIKLYLMVGLPGQGRKDLDEIASLIIEIKKRFNGSVYSSINPFVPKPKTNFANHKFEKEKIKDQISYLKQKLRGKYKIASIPLAQKEWKLAFCKRLLPEI